MADSNYGGQIHNVFSMAPTPPALRPQDSETLSPSYPHYASFSASELPPYNHYASPHRPQLPEPYNGFPHPYMQNHHRQLPPHAGPRAAAYYPPAMPMFQHGPHAASGLTTAARFHDSHMPTGPFPECPEPRAPPIMDHSMQGGATGFSSPSFPGWSSPPFPAFNRLPNSYMPSTPPTPGRFGEGSMRPLGEGRGPMRRADSGTSDLPRHMTSPGRRASHDRPIHNVHASGGSERRPLSAIIGPPTRRPDRSTSPRTSNRRSFDRYSTDLSQSGNATASSDAAQGSMHRVRRPRTIGFSSSYRARMMAAHHEHPNVPSLSQMQALKDKLRHLLPGELPEDASTTCDICQKDYSAEHIDPSEDAEVAIMLPCKHIFGEYCINTWFETCKTHKNKVTCPMCRKLLVEPRRPEHEVFRPGHEVLQALAARDHRLLERYYQLEERHVLGITARDLEG